MHNPLAKPDYIRVGYDAGGYHIRCGDINTHTLLCFGKNPLALVLFIHANNIRHFDYENSLADNCDAFDALSAVMQKHVVGA